MIRTGKWCRNSVELNGRFCAIGLARKSAEMVSDGSEPYSLSDAMLELLDVSIPADEFDKLRGRSYGIKDEYGGFYRGSSSVQSRVASFNNTRPSEQEVADWFEHAREVLEEMPHEELA
jgi:hypothetical protein